MDLIAGPFFGEFGWELCAWQGVIRVMSKNYDHTIVYGLPGHQYLYEDFMDEYIEFDPKGTEPNMWMNNGDNFELPMHHRGSRWIKPQQFVGLPDSPRQEFIKFGAGGERTMVAYHARNLTKYGSGYMNWDLKSWHELLDHYSNVICIGTKTGSDYAGGVDIRGSSLEETCDALSKCSVLIGPSSGAIHLGSLCGTPHVVWSGHVRNKLRYEEWWNPLNTPVRVICPENGPWDKKEEWQPTPKEIIDEVYLLQDTKEIAV